MLLDDSIDDLAKENGRREEKREWGKQKKKMREKVQAIRSRKSLLQSQSLFKANPWNSLAHYENCSTKKSTSQNHRKMRMSAKPWGSTQDTLRAATPCGATVILTRSDGDVILRSKRRWGVETHIQIRLIWTQVNLVSLRSKKRNWSQNRVRVQGRSNRASGHLRSLIRLFRSACRNPSHGFIFFNILKN